MTYLISPLQSRDSVSFYQPALVHETTIFDDIICTSHAQIARK